MSICYTVKEQLTAKNTHNGEYTLLNEAIENMQFQYAKLGALVLLDLAHVEKMNLVADGKTYSFSGKVLKPEFQELLSALNPAETIELNAEYEFWHYASYDDWDVGPFNTANVFKSIVKENKEVAKDFYYAMHNQADCNDGDGILCTIGELK